MHSNIMVVALKDPKGFSKWHFGYLEWIYIMQINVIKKCNDSMHAKR